MLLALFAPAVAGVLVNEVVYRTSESSPESEWVELCNTGPDTVDLAGWQIEAGTTAWSEAYTFASGTLAPGDHLLVGAGSASFPATFSPALGNATSSADGVRLKDASGNVIDTLLYGTSNPDGYTDDDGASDRLAAPTGDDESLGRWPDCADTDDASADFAVYGTPSPGAANAAPSGGTGGDADCTGSAAVKVNELMPNPSGADSGQEWVELFNGGAGAVDVSGWVLQWDTSSFDSASEYALPEGTTIAPGGYLLLGAGGLAVSLDMGNASSSADGVRLACNGAAVDTVVYGSDNSDALPDDSGAAATSLAPEPTEGRSLARPVDGADTDASAADFASSTPTPGASNAGVAADCVDGVVVNELTYETDLEWVELYNASGETADLAGWALEWGTSSYNQRHDFAEGDVLAPGDWLVIGSAGSGVADIVTDLDLGNASNADALRLVCGSTPIDTVIYGTTNSDGWTDDTGDVATSIAPKPGSGETIARVQDGWDTDQSGSDFAVAAPTPGAENPYTEPPVCDPTGFDQLKINELVFNPEGSDDDQEWVELYNGGSVPVRLDGAVLEKAGSAWGEAYVFPGGTELAGGAFLVVGGANAEVADFVSDALDLGNASSSGDGVRLVDCEGAVVDSVLWGDENSDGLDTSGGASDTVPDPGEGASLGRFPDGADNDDIVDWHPYLPPSPGAPNADPGATGNDDTGDDGGGGCNGDRPDDGGKPGGGCATVLPLGGWEAALAALAMLRRRRR